ncbi:MAG: hypothetical protein HY013_06230, partial [Candidatus Solibacter usitatus]|nr:hypothetical protein [Candidatus Solibacter usitatus]
MNEYRLILKPEAADGIQQDSALQQALRQGATERELVERASGGLEELSRLYYFLDRWRGANLIHYELWEGSRKLATIEPLIVGFTFAPAPLPGTPVLSRFAYLRRIGDATVLESPLSPVRIRLEPEAVGAALALSTPELVEMLLATGFIEDAAASEPGDRLVWEFHDLLFHRRSRHCGDSGQVGGTYRFRDRLEPWPALRPPYSGKRIALARPDMEELSRQDPPLTRVLEGRRSVREAGRPPLTLGQLSEFLYRTAAIRETARGQQEELVRRVFPSGGGIHELEFYLSVDQCQGLARGFYHYHSGEHALYRLKASRK